MFGLLQKPPAHPGAGDKLPSCTFYDADLHAIHTDSLKGHVVVLDFWASWNSASRKHNLQLVKLYEKYRQLLFRKKHQVVFLSVSMDTQREFWMIARAKDDLHWPHNICDFKGWESEAITALNLYKIPTNFVVDPHGVIVARDCWENTLDSTLSRLVAEMPN